MFDLGWGVSFRWIATLKVCDGWYVSAVCKWDVKGLGVNPGKELGRSGNEMGTACLIERNESLQYE